MNRIALFLGPFLCLYFAVSAQNLVPNYSLESTSPCPSSSGQMGYATSWASYMNSPDYYHSCGSGNYTTPGPNLGGTQIPSHGNAYFASVCKHSTVLYREYSGAMLTTPLSIGQQYDVSLKVSLTDISQYAANRFGVYFNTAPSATTGNFAHVYAATAITDKNGWVTISGTFTATAAYTYVFVGNFYDDPSTTIQSVAGGTYAGAYYYVDEIVVTPAVVLPSAQLKLSHLENRAESVLLGWEAPENDLIQYYLLERSLDEGKSYEEIAKVEAGTESLFRYTDSPNRYLVPIIYRLRSVDVNGYMALSNAVETSLLSGTELNLDIFPNPTFSGNNVWIRFIPVADVPHLIEVSNLHGQIVWEKSILPSEIEDGVLFNTSNIAAGTYLVKLRAKDRIEVKKLSITN